MCIISLFLPQVAKTGTSGPQSFFGELVTVFVPAFSYNEEMLAKETLLLAEAEYENRQAAEASQSLSGEQAGASGIDGMTDANGAGASAGTFDAAGAEVQSVPGEQNGKNDAADASNGVSPSDGTDALEKEDGLQDSSDLSEAVGTAEETAGTGSTDPAEDSDAATRILMEKLKDFDYLVQNYYIVDSSTTIRSTDLNAEELLSEDLAVDQTADGPQILIYHTHSQEGYQDSKEGDPSSSVVALGEKLAELLTERGFRVLHHTGEYDVEDRDHAYSNAAPAIRQLLEENPTIEVVIDLHRDSVPEENRLVTTIDGKPTAKIMFFNGLCRTTASGDLTSLQNPYLKDNLAFSLQMQLAAAQAYPDLTRKIYLKGYRYNMHFCPKSLLVEVGAQNNTFEEALNAMEPLASLLAEVLQ
jgi:stage II sporulation protein P